MNLRKVEVNDLVKLSICNLHNISENYCMRYWEYVIISWPELSFLAEDEKGKVVGYVLSSIEPDESEPQSQPVGQINSLPPVSFNADLEILEDAMLRDDVTIEYIQLHVRKSNKPALSLYNKLGYVYHHTVKEYYADGEDAFIMRLQLQPVNSEQLPRPTPHIQRRQRQAWLTNLWHFLHDRPRLFADAAMSLLRRRNSLP